MVMRRIATPMGHGLFLISDNLLYYIFNNLILKVHVKKSAIPLPPMKKLFDHHYRYLTYISNLT